MECQEVEPLLVAWHDGELAPSATHQVEEHLHRCAHCVHRSQRLLAATPEPWASPTAEVQRRLEQALDVDHVLAEADRRGPSTAARRMPRWLTEPREVRPITLLAYAALLAVSLGWGWLNWARMPATGSIDLAGTHAPAPTADVIPADAYAPASYQPAENTGPSQDEATSP